MTSAAATLTTAKPYRPIVCNIEIPTAQQFVSILSKRAQERHSIRGLWPFSLPKKESPKFLRCDHHDLWSN
jgi:hypothetical protein